MTIHRLAKRTGRLAVLVAAALQLPGCGGSTSTPTSSDPAPTAPVSIAQDLTTGMASLQASLASHATDDIVTSATAFDSAARNAAADSNATEGQRNQAYFYGAVARLVLLANPYSNVWPTAMNKAGDVLDAYGLGGTRTQRSKLETIQFTDCTSGPCTLMKLSPSSPRTAALQGFLGEKVVTELQEAATRFGKVTSTFQSTITHDSRRVWFDYTDARFLKGVCEAAIAAIRLQEAYRLDVDLVATQNGSRWTTDTFLAANPSLLTLQSATSLPIARAQAIVAVQSLKDAVAALKAETGNQTDHFVKLTASRCTYQGNFYSCTTVVNPPDQIADLETYLNEIGAALAASGPHTFAVRSLTATFVPDTFFAGVDIRAKLPPSVYVGAPMPDPTLGGVLVSPTLERWPSIPNPLGRWF